MQKGKQMESRWSVKRVIGTGAVCLALAAGCVTRQPVGPSAAEQRASAAANRSEAAVQRAEAAAARAEAAAGRAEQVMQQVEAMVEKVEGRFGKDIRSLKKISAHEHYRAGGDIKPYLATMEWANIEKAVFVPTDWPPSNPKYKDNLKELLALKRQYPEQIVVFATAYNKDPEAAKIIEEAIKDGAQGIKFIDWLASSKHPDEAGSVDSGNMYRIYEVAKRYRVPVLFHIDFQKRPDWKRQFERVAADFPNVTFILAHYCRAASGKKPALELCADALDKFPNVFVDISMGGGLKRYIRYFDENPALWHDFILHYQDRILWGTDIILVANPSKFTNATEIRRRMFDDFLIFQRTTYRSQFYQDDKTLHKGLELPASVLRKIYYENPKRILGIQSSPKN